MNSPRRIGIPQCQYLPAMSEKHCWNIEKLHSLANTTNQISPPSSPAPLVLLCSGHLSPQPNILYNVANIETVSNRNCPSVSLFTAFILKSILSQVLWPQLFFLFICLEYFFQPFTFSLCRSFVLRWVSCRQHMCGSYFLICSATLYLLNGAYNLFTFKVIIDRYLFIAIFPPLDLCSSLSLSLCSSS